MFMFCQFYFRLLNNLKVIYFLIILAFSITIDYNLYNNLTKVCIAMKLTLVIPYDTIEVQLI